MRGLVIGKFLPPHKGHLALISFAARQCDEVIVSLSDADSDTIDPKLRLQWLEELTSMWPNVKVKSLRDDFDRPELPLKERTSIWADIIRKAYGQIDKIFSSEEYGDSFAANLGAIHVPFDPGRKLIPVSASVIREQPFRYWEFIPDLVKPYFVKKICIYGAESTGKSTLANKLAKHYDTVAVPEVAREMLVSNDFTIDDIIRIGVAQTERVLEMSKVANKLLFCDTDVITTEVYSKHYLDVIPEILFELEKKVVYDKYFFMDVDVPWVADGLRDLGERRLEMREVFKAELDKRGIDYTIVKGTYEERESIVRNWIDTNFLNS